MINNVLEFVVENKRANPEGVALVDKSRSYTWKEVGDKVQGLATTLIEKKICTPNANKPVPVLMNKFSYQICVFWAVAYTGNFYVPIDEKMPSERIRIILNALESDELLCDSENFEKAQGIVPLEKIFEVNDLETDVINEELINEVKNRIIDTDPLYTLFTSGSTGMPKGVICNHRSVISYSHWVVETFNFGKDTILGNQTPLYFSMSILDVYSILRCAGTLCIIPKALFMQPVKLVNYLNSNRVNALYWVPSALCLISKFKVLDKCKIKYLKKVLFAGEVMPTKQLNYWIHKMPDVLYANLFGPTEITDIGTYYIVERELNDDEPVPIGKPCANVDVLILDNDLQKVPQGEIGELFFRGTYLGMGYYGDLEKTADVYIQNPLNNKYPELLYRSGDLVRINERNEIVYVCRKDAQIKHMGYRIELGEIENSFNAVDGVDRVCCFLDDEKDKIVAIYTTDGEDGQIEKTIILHELEKKLPKYMIPNIIIYMDKIPLNANGKINRNIIKENYLRYNG